MERKNRKINIGIILFILIGILVFPKSFMVHAMEQQSISTSMKATTKNKTTKKALKAYKNFLKKKTYNGKKAYYFAVVTTDTNQPPILLLTKNVTKHKKYACDAIIYQYIKGKVKKVKEIELQSTSLFISTKKGYLVYATATTKTFIKFVNGKINGWYYNWGYDDDYIFNKYNMEINKRYLINMEKNIY
jgi:hypothetical protein